MIYEIILILSYLELKLLCRNFEFLWIRVSKSSATSCSSNISLLPSIMGIKIWKFCRIFYRRIYPTLRKTTAINNLIRSYSFMRSYLNIIPFIYHFFNSLFSIFHIESLFKYIEFTLIFKDYYFAVVITTFHCLS